MVEAKADSDSQHWILSIWYSLAGSDYENTTSQLTFIAGSFNLDTVEASIAITNDQSFEKDEIFTVHLTSEDRVIIHENYTDVLILDDESEWIQLQ